MQPADNGCGAVNRTHVVQLNVAGCCFARRRQDSSRPAYPGALEPCQQLFRVADSCGQTDALRRSPSNVRDAFENMQ
jgi:hypothetical protein